MGISIFFFRKRTKLFYINSLRSEKLRTLPFKLLQHSSRDSGCNLNQTFRFASEIFL